MQTCVWLYEVVCQDLSHVQQLGLASTMLSVVLQCRLDGKRWQASHHAAGLRPGVCVGA